MKTRKSKTNCLVKMSKSFKAKVLKALRSDKYKQTSGCLYDSDYGAYCALGVMCSLVDVDNYDLNRLHMPGDLPVHIFEKLPPFLKQRPILPDGSSTILQKIADMNDDGKSFKQIAAYIERYL